MPGVLNLSLSGFKIPVRMRHRRQPLLVQLAVRTILKTGSELFIKMKQKTTTPELESRILGSFLEDFNDFMGLMHESLEVLDSDLRLSRQTTLFTRPLMSNRSKQRDC